MADINVDLLGEDAVAKAVAVIAGFRDQAQTSKDSAAGSAAAATTAYNGIILALAVGALSGPYLTKAAADAAAAAGTIPAGAYILVATDSTQKGATTIRQRVGSASTTTFTFALGSVSDGFLTTTPVVAANAFYQLMLKAPAPLSGMVGTSGINDAVTSTFQVGAGRITNGPPGAESYYNTVVGFGINSGTPWTPENPALPSSSFRIEAKYAIGPRFFTEMHASQLSKDNPSHEFRSFSTIVPHNESDWPAYSESGLRGSIINFTDGTGAQRVSINSVTSNIFLAGSGGNNLKLNFSQNGAPVATQPNSANNAFLNLPYFNSTDALVMAGHQLCVGGMKNIPELGAAAMVGYNCVDAVADGAFMLLVPSAGVTGNLWGLRVHAVSVSGTLTATEFANNHASGHIEDRRYANGNILTTLYNYHDGYSVWQHGSIYSTNLWILSAGGQNALEVHGATGDLNVARGKVKIGGVQVLSTQQTHIPDIAGGANVATVLAKVNEILAMLRAHGLIAAA